MESIVPARVSVGSYRQTILPEGSPRQEGSTEFRLPNEKAGEDQDSAGRKEGESSIPKNEGASQIARDERARKPEKRQEEGLEGNAVGHVSPTDAKAENISQKTWRASNNSLSNQVLHVDHKQPTEQSGKSGTATADIGVEMSRLLKTTPSEKALPKWLISADKMPRQIVKAAALVQRAAMPRPASSQKKDQERMEPSTPGPSSSFASSNSAEVQRPEAPQPAMEINPLLLKAIARLQEGNHSTLRFAMRTPDGHLLNVQLKLRGGRMNAVFRTADKALQQSIEQGWGALVREANKQGVQLEAPEFEAGSGPRLDGNHYA